VRHQDVREALPLIQAPTLVIHSRDCFLTPIEHGRYLAERIPGAKLVEMSTTDVFFFVGLFDEIAEFLTGERPTVPIDRILTTVLFTDIVGSTAQAASLGDQQWRSTLDAHDRAVREQLRRFRGNEINTTGDGFVASFDGPARAIRCAEAISGATQELGVELRFGLHTGECEVRGDDLGGLAVHIAARVAAAAEPNELPVSSTVKDLVAGSGIEFEDCGDHQLKGVPGDWRLYAASALAVAGAPQVHRAEVFLFTTPYQAARTHHVGTRAPPPPPSKVSSRRHPYRLPRFGFDPVTRGCEPLLLCRLRHGLARRRLACGCQSLVSGKPGLWSGPRPGGSSPCSGASLASSWPRKPRRFPSNESRTLRNSWSPRPTWRPISGSLCGPKTSAATTSTISRCQGERRPSTALERNAAQPSVESSC